MSTEYKRDTRKTMGIKTVVKSRKQICINRKPVLSSIKYPNYLKEEPGQNVLNVN